MIRKKNFSLGAGKDNKIKCLSKGSTAEKMSACEYETCSCIYVNGIKPTQTIERIKKRLSLNL